jgi:hypothetical protein
MKPQSGIGCAADCIYDARDTFITRLSYRWISLPPGTFYGTVVVLHSDFFPQLDTTGRWRLRGPYKSTGDLASSLCWDRAPIPDIREQIKGRDRAS